MRTEYAFGAHWQQESLKCIKDAHEKYLACVFRFWYGGPLMNKKPPKTATVRKNISLHPEVQKRLLEIANADFTSASAVLTAMILERHRVLNQSALSETKSKSTAPEMMEDAKKDVNVRKVSGR